MSATASSRLHLGVFPWRAAPSEPSSDRRSSVPDQARTAERLGFDSFWLPESHFVAQARPAPLLELAAAAAVTRRVRLGVTSYLLPIRHPLLVAEEVAVLDRLSHGRLILGLGRGFRPELFAAFGVRRADKRELFEDALGAMLRAWRGEPVTGSNDSAGVSLFPLPWQRPHPPLWVAAFGPKGLLQAARLGLPYLASPLEPFERLRTNIEQHRSHRAAAHAGSETTGHENAVPILRTVFVSRNARQIDAACRALAPEVERWRRVLGESESQDEREIAVDEYALLGGPDEVARQIERYRRELGMTHLVVRSPPGVSAAALERSLRELSDLAL